MTLIAFAGAVWAFCFLATAIAEEKMFSTAANGVPETPKTLVQEIAAIEAQIDAIQEAAIAGIPSLLPGSPQRLQALGKLLFFDKELSVNRNEACAFCHMPQTGYQGAFESLNVSSVAMPGSVRTRFALRKPPSAAYAASTSCRPINLTGTPRRVPHRSTVSRPAERHRLAAQFGTGRRRARYQLAPRS